MATLTSNYKLKKPATTDKISISDINANMDIIDTTMKTIANSSASGGSGSGSGSSGRQLYTKSIDTLISISNYNTFTILKPFTIAFKYGRWDIAFCNVEPVVLKGNAEQSININVPIVNGYTGKIACDGDDVKVYVKINNTICTQLTTNTFEARSGAPQYCYMLFV